MDWTVVGSRIRKQREYLGYTREQLAEQLDVSTKFCSDIELGVKGMSIPTLCKIARILRLSTDYILFGTLEQSGAEPLELLLKSCSKAERHYAEQAPKNLFNCYGCQKRFALNGRIFFGVCKPVTAHHSIEIPPALPPRIP